MADLLYTYRTGDAACTPFRTDDPVIAAGLYADENGAGKVFVVVGDRVEEYDVGGERDARELQMSQARACTCILTSFSFTMLRRLSALLTSPSFQTQSAKAREAAQKAIDRAALHATPLGDGQSDADAASATQAASATMANAPFIN